MLTLLILAVFARAETGFHATPVDPSFDASHLGTPAAPVAVDPAPAATGKGGIHLPTPQERESAFASAGLTASLSGWQEMDLDRLFLRARNDDVNELLTAYPTLPGANLKKLSKKLRGRK